MEHDPSSLLSRKSRGGLIGGPGYTAQTVVLLHRLPKLIEDADFKSCMLEGQEDFDLHFERDGKKSIHLVQTKSKTLSNPELRELINGMYERHVKDPELYECFEIVARDFPSAVGPFRHGLHRYQNTREAYQGSSVEAATHQHLQENARTALLDLGCNPDIPADWLIDKVALTTNIPIYPFDEAEIVDGFASRCTDCRQYGVQVLAPFRKACAALQQHLELHRGEAVDRDHLARTIHDFCEQYQEKVSTEGVKVHLDHWRDVDGRARTEADEVFEWRERYKTAGPSRVPAPEVTQEVLAELQDFERKTMTVWKNASITLMHPCSISAAVVFGHTYRKVKGYRLSVTAPEEVFSMAGELAPRPVFREPVREDEPGDAVVVGLGVGRNITRALQEHKTEHQLEGPLVVFQSLDNPINPAQARRLANDFVEVLRDLHSEGFKSIHLFYSGPITLAAFIGHLCNKIGPLYVYEYGDDGKYHQAFVLQT